MKQSKAWRRIAAEGIVIVASILLAFGIEAWCAGRQERAEESRILARLQVELVADAEQLQRQGGRHRSIRDATMALLLHTAPSPSDQMSPDSTGALLSTMTQNPTFQASGGALTSLISGGDLSIVSNEDLRTQLAGWIGVVSDLRDQERVAQDIGHNRLNPYLESQIRVRNVYSLQPSAGQEEFAPGAISEGLSQLLREPRFEGIVATRHRVAVALVGKYEEAINRLEGLLGDLERELSNSN